MAIKQALGRGLSALIPSGPVSRIPSDAIKNEQMPAELPVTEIPLSRIRPNPGQPRKDYDAQRMQELVQSIRQKGVLQPILVRPLGDGYEVIAGERRYRAAKTLGLQKIPAVVRVSQADESLELALIENLQREDLNPLEEARAYDRLLKEFHLTQETIANAVGKDRSSVANAVRLLALPEKIQERIRKNQLSVGHAKVLLGIADRNKQEWLCDKILRESLSVRQAEQLLLQAVPPKAKAGKKLRENDPHLQWLQDELQKVLGTRVRIAPSGKGGHLQIDYFSHEDLERILKLLGVSKRW